MLGWLYHRMLRGMEKRYGYDATYLHEVVDAAPVPHLATETVITPWEQKGAVMRSLVELVKIRASQINSCAYCIHMHVGEALKDGEDATRVHLLAGWRDSHAVTYSGGCWRKVRLSRLCGIT